MNTVLWEGPLSDLGHLRDAFLEGIVPSELGVVSSPDGNTQFFMAHKDEDVRANFLLYYGKWANAKSYYVPRGIPASRITDVCSYIDPSLSISLTSFLGYYLVCSTTYLPEDLKVLFEEGYFIHRLPKNRDLHHAFASSLCSEAFSNRYTLLYKRGALYIGDCSREIFMRIVEKYQEILNDIITSECKFSIADTKSPYRTFEFEGVLYQVPGPSQGDRETYLSELRSKEYLDWKVLDGMTLSELHALSITPERTFDIPLQKEESDGFSNITVYYYITTKGSKVPVARLVMSELNIEELFQSGRFFQDLFKNMYEDYGLIIEQDPIDIIDQLKK